METVIQENKIPTVAIVGRPNVGKSSLFNAIIGRRLSIVHEMSGVTRDRIMAPASWQGKHFQLIDTGGLGTLIGEKKNVDIWDKRISEQCESAIEGADILIFVCNIQDGIVSLDEEVAERLRTCGRKVIVAANKADNSGMEENVHEFEAFGFNPIIPVSTLHRRNIGTLLDEVLQDIPQVSISDLENEPFGIAVVGRPNVGKSSIINCLLGDDRVIVSDTAGTTRDSVDIDFSLEYRDEEIPAKLIDTAGLRKKAKVRDAVEMFSIMRTKEAIERARFVLFLIEAGDQGTTAQDRRIARLIEESGKACVVVANKLDTCKEHKIPRLLERIRYTMPGMSYAPVVFTSAIENYGMEAMLDQIAQVMEQMEVRIPTSMVNRVISDAVERVSPPVVGVAPLKTYYSAMISTEPPRFLLFVNNPKYCAPNYLTYLRNALRSAFDFTGLPIILELRARPKKIESIRTPRKHTPKAGKPAPKRATAKSQKPVKPNSKKNRKKQQKK
jgi:GTP-binding protein